MKKLLALLLFWLAASLAHAQVEVNVQRAQIEFADDGLYFSGQVSFELPKSLEEAAQRGTPLFFTAEVAIRRNRWYWTDEKLADVIRVVRVEYLPLLRRYRVSTGGLGQTVETLNEAMALAQRGIRFKLVDRKELSPDGRYRAEFIYKLDLSRMSRLFQIGATSQREFLIEADRIFNFRVPERWPEVSEAVK
jgi:hypothetical protein